jgi:hypothetical protein
VYLPRADFVGLIALALLPSPLLADPTATYRPVSQSPCTPVHLPSSAQRDHGRSQLCVCESSARLWFKGRCSRWLPWCLGSAVAFLRCSHESSPVLLVAQALMYLLLVYLLYILGECVPGPPSSGIFVRFSCQSTFPPWIADERWPVDVRVTSVPIQTTRAFSTVIFVNLCSPRGA